MKRVTTLTAVFIMLVCVAISAQPARGEVAGYAKLGTLGVEAGMEAQINKYLSLRVGAGYLGWSFDNEIDDVNYEFDFSLFTLGGYLDWHPTASGFRLSAGVLYNANDFDGSASPSPLKTYEFGGTDYLGAVLGDLDASAEFNQVAPYLGLGYGNTFGEGSPWSFQVDLGVMYWGSPDVTLTSSNSALVPGLQENLNKEVNKIEDDLEILSIYPVFSMGLAYRF